MMQMNKINHKAFIHLNDNELDEYIDRKLKSKKINPPPHRIFFDLNETLIGITSNGKPIKVINGKLGAFKFKSDGILGQNYSYENIQTNYMDIIREDEKEFQRKIDIGVEKRELIKRNLEKELEDWRLNRILQPSETKNEVIDVTPKVIKKTSVRNVPKRKKSPVVEIIEEVVEEVIPDKNDPTQYTPPENENDRLIMKEKFDAFMEGVDNYCYRDVSPYKFRYNNFDRFCKVKLKLQNPWVIEEISKLSYDEMETKIEELWNRYISNSTNTY